MRKLKVLVLATVVALIGGSVYSAGMPLPFFEDFTGVAEGDIPVDWSRDDIGWGVANSNYAGGVSPEMVFEKEAGVGVFRLNTPVIDGASASNITLNFKYVASGNYYESYMVRVQTSIDGGLNWQECWSAFPNWPPIPTEDIIYLDAVVGHEFIVSFVFDGEAEENFWLIDDVFIAETQELDMLTPVGQGGVAPSVGKHDLPCMQEITLRALPSSTWYAFNHHTNTDPFKFDPADMGSIMYIGTNTIDIRGGTWAADAWYAISYDPSSLYTVNPENGVTTFVGETGQRELSSITYDELNDIMYACGNSKLYSLNRRAGAAKLIGSPGTGVSAIAFGDGILYGYSASDRSIYTIDVETGAATLLGPINTDLYPYNMEYDKDHDRLFVTLIDYSTDDYLGEVDKTTGSVHIWFKFNQDQKTTGFAIPYHINHPWEFDHWEVDGVFHSNDPAAPIMMDANHTAQAFFTTPSLAYTLIMLTPAGVGTGTVSPPVGTRSYVENAKAYLLAIPDRGFLVDYWEVDGAFYSNSHVVCLVMDADYTAQVFFKNAHWLEMLAPGGTGIGTVTPEPGIHNYEIGAEIEISAVPAFDSRFDYWEINGSVYSTSPTETLVMNDNYTVQAFFKLVQDYTLPFIEDFSDVAEGAVPIDWSRDETEWGVGNTNSAGGESPEMIFTDRANYYEESLLITPPIDGTTASNLVCRFKHALSYTHDSYTGTFFIGVLTSIDNGASWKSQWYLMPYDKILPETVTVDLSGVAGNVFRLAFVVDHDTYNLEKWHIDDVFIGESAEPTPTPTPEPTPGYPLGVRLEMPDMARPGYDFYITGYIDNPGDPLVGVPIFFILEVFGKFWFWPSWAYFDYPEYTQIDYESISVPTGTSVISVILPFEWPYTNQGVVRGLGFYGAMLNPEMTDIMGEIAYRKWGYGPYN